MTQANNSDRENETGEAEWHRKDLEMTTRLTAGVIAGVAGIPFGPFGGVVSGMLTPPIEAALKAAADRHLKNVERNEACMLTSASAESSTELQDLLIRITEDPTLLQLLASAFETSARTEYQEKIIVLGRALGRAASDNAAIDPEQLVISAMSEVEPPHATLLAYIVGRTRREPPLGGRWEGVSERAIAHDFGIEGFGGVSLLQPLLRVLDRNGMIKLTADGEPWDENMADDIAPDAGTNEWAATRFGADIHARLIDAAEDISFT